MWQSTFYAEQQEQKETPHRLYRNVSISKQQHLSLTEWKMEDEHLTSAPAMM